MRIKLFHGSSFGGLHGFESLRAPVYFTPHREIAEAYARGSVHNTQRAQGARGEPHPTIYTVAADVEPFDLRDADARGLYTDFVRKHADPEDPLPRLAAEGFIAPRTGLPAFSYAVPLWTALGASNERRSYDSVWVDEGSQGVSLAVFKLSHVRIVGEERL